MGDMSKNSERWIETVETAKAVGMKRGLGEAIEGGPQAAEQFFKDWEANVIAQIPADRLLVHHAKDGWEPLCKFLGMEVPDEPYPRANDKAAIQNDVKNLKMMNFAMFYVTPALLAIGAYFYF